MEGNRTMTAVRITPRKLRGQKREEPFIYLYCNTRGCTENERIHMTTFDGLRKWLRENEWVIVHRGGHLFDHRCPKCEHRRLGLSADFRERLHA